MLRAVLFDLDNTLVDFLKMKELCSEAAIYSMIEAGLPLEEKKAKGILFEMYEEVGFENQKIFEEFLQRTMGRLDYRILAAGVAAYRRVKAGHLVPYAHVRETLIKLKERALKLGIVSDAPRMQAWLRLAEMNLLEFFDVVIALEDTGKLKPSRLPFKEAVQRLGVNPREILFVGDNPERDIKGAARMGMHTALAKYGQFAKGSPKAEHELKSALDILKAVDRYNKR
jgi:putative hydrolase of the HAD superfamily